MYRASHLLSRFATTSAKLFLLLAFLGSDLSRAERILGKVIAVSDGDTITVLDAKSQWHKIRLAGIDAPESGQPFGKRSKSNLSDAAHGQEVIVEFQKTDRYGRKVGKVLVSERDINLDQIKAGLAWHYKAYDREQSENDRNQYAEAEREGKQSRRSWASGRKLHPNRLGSSGS
jgi:endonuclease YncB( thermonuclease family)